MALDELTSNDGFKAFASIITGGAFVGWYREHRRSKKDAYGFAMDLLQQQNLRIDALVMQVAKLEARVAVEADAVAILKQENEELKAENARLKTALGEHGRAA